MCLPLSLNQASLCVNELSKAPKDISAEKWEAIARQFVPNFTSMSARNLTLLINALSHARVPKEGWASAAWAAAKKVPTRGFSAQDLCLLLSSMVRLSCYEQSLVLRLLAEDCPPRVWDLEARGITGFAHAVTRLGQDAGAKPQAEALMQELLPKMRILQQDLLPLELALAVDALSRYGTGTEPLVHGEPQLPTWADVAISDLEESLAAGLSRLKPLEVVMVISALSRRGYVASDGLATGLSHAVTTHFARWPAEELCIVVHSAARLGLPGLVDGTKAPVPSILQHVEANVAKGYFLTECSPDHAVLLLHGLAKLLVQPTARLWASLLNTARQKFTRATAIRLSLAAAKLDFKHDAVRGTLKQIVVSEPLGALSDDAFAAVISALMHPFYCQGKFTLQLLLHMASSRHVKTQSLALQTRVGLIDFAFHSRLERCSLAEILSLAELEVKTSEKPEWSRKLLSRPSALQSDVHFEVNAVLGRQRVDAEILIWPFCIDLVWLREKESLPAGNGSPLLLMPSATAGKSARSCRRTRNSRRPI